MDDRAELLTLLDACRAEGARAVEVLHQRHERFLTTGMRIRPARTTEEAWTARVWLDGGRAGVATAPTRKGLAERAVAAARLAPLSELAGPADRYPPPSGSLGIDDRRWGNVHDDDRNELLGTAERFLSVGGTVLRRLQYDEVRERRSLLSTREVELTAAATTWSLSAEATLGSTTLRHRIASRHFADVASLPFGLDLRRRLEGFVHAERLPDVPLPVVLDPAGMASLVRSLAPAFVAPGLSGSFLRGRLGRPLASPVLHVTDDAGQASGLYTWPFDERGVVPFAVPLLKEGVPNSLFHDPESARAAGLRPTGHVREGTVRPSNLVVRPGSRTRNVILGELADHLVVDELPPVALATGRIQGPCRVGVVRAGARTGGLVVHLDLDVGDLLSRVVEVASDQERCQEVDTPTTVFAPLPFTG